MRSRAAFTIYLAALAKAVTTDYKNHELFIEWMRAEGDINDLTSSLSVRKHRQTIFNAYKRAVANEVLQEEKHLKTVFSKIEEKFSTNPALRPLLDTIRATYQQKSQAIFSKMKSFMETVKDSDGNVNDIIDMANIKNQLKK